MLDRTCYFNNENCDSTGNYAVVHTTHIGYHVMCNLHAQCLSVIKQHIANPHEEFECKEHPGDHWVNVVLVRLV